MSPAVTSAAPPRAVTTPAPGPGTARGARSMLLAQASRVAVTGLGIVVLSRLLPPEDFGVVAVVAAIMNVAVIVGDLGLSVAAIRERALSRHQWSALFWVNTAFGVLLAGLLAALAGPVAGLAGDPGLVTYLLAVTPVFILNGCSAQYRVQLVRDARFGALALLESVAPLLALVAAVALAVAGAGPWALIAQLVVAPAVLLVLSVAAVRRGPGLPRRAAGVGRLLRLGAVLSVQQVLDVVASSIAPLALGRHVHQGVVGEYSRATQLVKMPHHQLGGSLTRVVVPALANAGTPAELEQRLHTARATYGYVVGVLTAMVGGLAVPLVAVVLGPQWAEVTPAVVTVFAAGLLLQCISHVLFWGLTAVGATRALLKAEIPVYTIIIGGILIAAPHGAVAVAAVSCVGALARTVARVAVGPRAIGISRGRFLAPALPNLLVLALVLAVGLAVSETMAAHPAVLTLLAGTAATALVLAAAAAVSRTVRTDLSAAARRVAAVVGMRRRTTAHDSRGPAASTEGNRPDGTP